MAWLQAAETRAAIPAVKAGGRELPGLVLALDATLVTCHSEKDQAAPTYKGGFGFHPLLCFLVNTGEAMSGLLRPGNAGDNTAADHITVLDQALAQIPDAHRHGTDILVRTDSAGSAKAFLTHLRALRDNGLHLRFSVGYAVTAPVRRAIRALPEQVWHPALDADGTLRESAEAAELTGMVDLNGYPAGTRIIVRRERPHPGAQLSLFDSDEGLWHQVFLTDTPSSGGGSAQFRGGPPPWTRHRRGPHPVRQDHRLRTLPIPPVLRQRRLARTQPRGYRPSGLDPRPAAGRRAGYRRTQETPLPDSARRCPSHPRRTPPPSADRSNLALATPTRRRLPPSGRPTPPRQLTSLPRPPTTRKTLENPTNAPGPHHAHRPIPPRSTPQRHLVTQSETARLTPHASAAISFPGFEQSSCGRSCLRASGCPALGSVLLCLADLITDHRLAGAADNRTQILEPHRSASSSPTAGGRTGGHRPP